MAVHTEQTHSRGIRTPTKNNKGGSAVERSSFSHLVSCNPGKTSTKMWRLGRTDPHDLRTSPRPQTPQPIVCWFVTGPPLMHSLNPSRSTHGKGVTLTPSWDSTLGGFECKRGGGGGGGRKHVWPLQYQTGGGDIEIGLRDWRGDIFSAKNTRPIGHDDWIRSQLDAEARFRNAWYSMHWGYHVQNGWNFAVFVTDIDSRYLRLRELN